MSRCDGLYPVRMARTVFVTGTDTGIGKSIASAALLHAFNQRGIRALGMKPVASGCDVTPDGLRNEDALLLQAAGAVEVEYATINPYALAPPIAPEFAARDAGVAIALPRIVEAHARLASMADRVVVEGVGGWMAPLSATLDQRDVARALDADVVLVVGLRLGCISHARLSARSIVADGLRLAGWIGSTLDPAMPHLDDNVAALHARIDAPCWGVLPFGAPPDPAVLSRALSIGTL